MPGCDADCGSRNRRGSSPCGCIVEGRFQRRIGIEPSFDGSVFAFAGCGSAGVNPTTRGLASRASAGFYTGIFGESGEANTVAGAFSEECGGRASAVVRA